MELTALTVEIYQSDPGNVGNQDGTQLMLRLQGFFFAKKLLSIMFYCMLLASLKAISFFHWMLISLGIPLIYLFLICKFLVAAAMLRALSILRISKQICCLISICTIMWKHFIVKFDTKPSSNTQLHLFLLICIQWPVPLKLVLQGWRRNWKL